MRKYLLIGLALLLLTGCSTLKTIRLVKRGKVAQRTFNVQVPFEYRLGLIVLKVNITGEDYDFLLDTGAPSVLSTELADKLSLEEVTRQPVDDSQGNDEAMGFVYVDRLGIGGVDFLNIGAAVTDLAASKEIRCLGIDGLIGANLMRKAVWHFDYTNQIITITNSLAALDLPSVTHRLPFRPDIVGTPSLAVTVNGEVENGVILDLGSNGGITLSADTYKALLERGVAPGVLSFGNAGSGLYGQGAIDATHYLKVDRLAFGDITLEGTVADFSSESPTIGNRFFRNYDLVISWSRKEVLLIQRATYVNADLSNFGFSYNNSAANVLTVSELFEGSAAQRQGLRLGDQIVRVNDTTYGEISQAEWCAIIERGLLPTGEELSVEVLRDGETLSFTLQYEKLL